MKDILVRHLDFVAKRIYMLAGVDRSAPVSDARVAQAVDACKKAGGAKYREASSFYRLYVSASEMLSRLDR